jgi:hypothetical protein
VSCWLDVIDGYDRLVCRYDPALMRIQVKLGKHLRYGDLRPFHGKGLPLTRNEQMFPTQADSSFNCPCGQVVRLNNREPLRCVCGRSYTLVSHVVMRE